MISSPPLHLVFTKTTLNHHKLINAAGYKPGAAKSADEYAKLDAEDESLARWKASLGIVPGAGGEASGPKVLPTRYAKYLLKLYLCLGYCSYFGARFRYATARQDDRV